MNVADQIDHDVHRVHSGRSLGRSPCRRWLPQAWPCPCAVACSPSQAWPLEVLSRLVSIHGAPLFMRSDDGPEFVSPAILEWIAHVLCVWIYRALGRWQRVSEPSRSQRQDL